MLVLSRKQGESVRIGDQVVLTILQIHGNRIQVGIEAPGSVAILRSELASPATLTAGRSPGTPDPKLNPPLERAIA